MHLGTPCIAVVERRRTVSFAIIIPQMGGSIQPGLILTGHFDNRYLRTSLPSPVMRQSRESRRTLPWIPWRVPQEYRQSPSPRLRADRKNDATWPPTL